MNLSTLRTHSVVPFDEIRYTFSGLLNLKFSYLQIASGYKDRTATEGPHDVGQKGVRSQDVSGSTLRHGRRGFSRASLLGRRELSLSSLGPHDVGQKGVATGRRELSLSSLIKGTFL